MDLTQEKWEPITAPAESPVLFRSDDNYMIDNDEEQEFICIERIEEVFKPHSLPDFIKLVLAPTAQIFPLQIGVVKVYMRILRVGECVRPRSLGSVWVQWEGSQQAEDEVILIPLRHLLDPFLSSEVVLTGYLHLIEVKE